MEDAQIKEVALGKCLAGKELWIQDGTVVYNYEQLLKAIKKQDDYTFSYHVNDDNHKNDYAKWVMDVCGDKVLCSKLLGAKTKDDFIWLIQERIDQLKIA